MKQRKNVIVIFILILGFFVTSCFCSCVAGQKNSEKTQEVTTSDWINEIGYPLFSRELSKSEGYKFILKPNESGVLLTISCKDLTKSLYDTDFSQWEDIKQAFCDVSESGHYSLLNYGVQASFSICLLNDKKPDEEILLITNGQVIYSISDN